MAPLASLCGALLIVGLPFVVQWERAKAIDPSPFGNVVATFVLVALVLAFVAGASVRRWRGRLVSFGLLSVAAGLAIVIAARSDSITAEGILTAMLLPVGLLAAGVVASLVDAGLTRRVERADVRTLMVMVTIVALSAVVAWRLPVVQFMSNARGGAIHPVQGSWLAFAGGVAAGAIAGQVWPRERWSWNSLLIPVALMLGYTLQASFGAVLAMIGVGVALPQRGR